MKTPLSTHSIPSHASVEVQIPEELEFFLAETAEDLEITPEELVQQAVGSYCRVKLGGRHE
jgi:hypothetical protein